LRQAAQLGQWRQQEAQLLNQVIAGVALSEAERRTARGCVQRLAERVASNRGTEMDHDLLARFLTRDVRLKGRLFQVMDRPALTFSAWEAVGFPVEGVAAVLRPSVALDGTEARVDGGDIYISNRRASGPRGGVGETIHAEQIPSGPGVRTLSCMVEAQLVHAKQGEGVSTGAHSANYQTIGNPVRIVLPSIDRFFVSRYPTNYPVEISDEPAAQLMADRFAVARATASMDSQSCVCEVEFHLPQMSPSFPIALGIDLLEFGGVSLETNICAILVDEQDSASIAENAAVQTLGSQVACLPDHVRYKIKFVVPGLKSLPFDSHTATAQFRIRASHRAALAAENMEHFLSVPELTQEVTVTLK